MAKQKKNFVPVNAKIEKEVADKLSELCEETGLSKTAVIENAVEMFFDYYKKTGKVR